MLFIRKIESWYITDVCMDFTRFPYLGICAIHWNEFFIAMSSLSYLHPRFHYYEIKRTVGISHATIYGPHQWCHTERCERRPSLNPNQKHQFHVKKLNKKKTKCNRRRMHPNLKRQPIQLPTLQVHHDPLCDTSRCRGDPGKGREGGRE